MSFLGNIVARQTLRNLFAAIKKKYEDVVREHGAVFDDETDGDLVRMAKEFSVDKIGKYGDMWEVTNVEFSYVNDGDSPAYFKLDIDGRYGGVGCCCSHHVYEREDSPEKYEFILA